MKRLPKEDRAGLYITVIAHLVVLIILLATQLGVALKKESSFVLDFTKAEQIEKLEKELALKKAINERLNEMLSEGGSVPVMNVAVDRSALKDDRSTPEEAERLYKDAEKLREALQKGAEPPQEEGFTVTAPTPKKEEQKTPAYSGPSVLSWELEGRKASHLPIPAYRCYGAGEVRVVITVSPRGDVVMAKVDEDVSSKDGCLRAFAIRAARLSRFSSSSTAPDRQNGSITYQFIAQ